MIVFMPTYKNVPNGHPGWELRACPKCGQKCWLQAEHVEFLKRITAGEELRMLCTECALRHSYEEGN